MNIGNTYELKVARIAELGYILTDKFGKEEILMHFNDSTKEYKEFDKVTAFIYLDSSKRMCATDYTSLIKEDEVKFLEVVDQAPKVGIFLDMGIRKHLLLGNDDLPDREFFPIKGDKVFVRMKTAKSGMFAKLVQKDDIDKYVKPTEPLEEGKKYMARVVKGGQAGFNLLTEDTFNQIFVYKLHARQKHRLGELVEVKITKANKYDYTGTLNEQKEHMIPKDKEVILTALINNGGYMNLDSKSHAEDIYRVLQMSKRAFKNALGGLYKERKIHFDNGKTFLVKEGK